MDYPPPFNPPPRRGRLPVWSTYGLMALFVIFVVGLGVFTFTFVRNTVANSPLGAGSEPIFADEPGGEQNPAIVETIDPDSRWTEGQVTILLMGIDERMNETGPWRTDTMILLTINPATSSAGMISIPRDLWVTIPDYNVFDRINTAHFRGDADRYPGYGGPSLAMKTVQNTLGVPVDYFVTVNFNAFLKTIDYLGCIPVEVPETIDDPSYPAYEGTGYDPFYIEAGDHCMDSDTLLKYARTRATFGADFDRATRQQQVIYAIRDHLLSTGEFPNLLIQAPQIYTTVSDGVETNLSLQQMVDLARVAVEVPDENICSVVIDGAYVDLQTLPDGTQILIPNRESIRDLRDQVFKTTGQCRQEDGLPAEGATITITNGSTQEGLATAVQQKLTDQGVVISAVRNADRFDYAETVIYSYKGKDETARYLAQMLDLSQTVVVAADNPDSLYDIEILLGNDFAGVE